jgi:hypothetical protein
MRVASIDVGRTHLGLVVARLNGRRLAAVDELHCVDIDSLPHRVVRRNACPLGHTRHIVDLVGHFLQEYRACLDAADVVLIERQLPGGMTDIESLLYGAYRDKAVLMSPQRMHRHFGIQTLDYDGRKEALTAQMEVRIGDTGDLASAQRFDAMPRRHDVADALAHLLVFAADQTDASNPLERWRYGAPQARNALTLADKLSDLVRAKRKADACDDDGRPAKRLRVVAS